MLNLLRWVVRALRGPTARSLKELRRQQWCKVEPPFVVMDFPSMLAYEERRLLYYLTREFWTGAGEVVDGGSCLGGSTAALAAGLHDSGRPNTAGRVHAYDLFTLDRYMIEEFLKTKTHLKHWWEVQPGASSLPIFRELTARYEKQIQVCEGDITRIGWCGRKIEVLFLDVLKSWAINDSVLANFFPYLMPGRSVVVQQDYVYECCPWIHITMEMLADYFEYIDYAPFSSTFWLLKKRIPKSLLSVSTEHDLDRKTQFRLMHQAVERFTGKPRGILECAEAQLYFLLGDTEQALRRLEQIKRAYADSEHVLFCHQAIEYFVRTGTGIVYGASKTCAKELGAQELLGP